MKPDWGHGPNPPVEMYTENEIRTALDCLGYWSLDAAQIIEKLKEKRDGREASQHQDTA